MLAMYVFIAEAGWLFFSMKKKFNYGKKARRTQNELFDPYKDERYELVLPQSKVAVTPSPFFLNLTNERD